MKNVRKKSLKMRNRLFADHYPAQYGYRSFINKYLGLHFSIEDGAKLEKMEPHWKIFDERIKSAFDELVDDERRSDVKTISEFIENIYEIYREGNKAFKKASSNYKTEKNCIKILNQANKKIIVTCCAVNLTKTLSIDENEMFKFFLNEETIKNAPPSGTTKDNMRGYREFAVENTCNVFSLSRSTVHGMMKKHKNSSKTATPETLEALSNERWLKKIESLRSSRPLK